MKADTLPARPARWPRAIGRWCARAVAPGLAAALVLAACQPSPPAGWSGYMEGDAVRVAPPVSGTLLALPVQAGQTVAAGAPLFTLEAEADRAAAAEAQARLQAGQALARNTRTGKRADELAVLQAQLAQARAQAQLAQGALARQRALQAQGFVSPAALDDAQAAVRQADANVAELGAALQVARLPARDDERSAAQANAEAAAQVLAQSSWRLAQKAQRAPVAGQVSETYYRVGEWVAAGAPVLALLPPGAVKARFYVPEAELAGVQPGQRVWLGCDGCAAPRPARIGRIATQAEYTPPVIYSNAQRARLVFMVEAWPEPPAEGASAPAALKPGQPVDVRPDTAATATTGRAP